MKTTSLMTNGNLSYRDADYPPYSTFWDDCPKLAALRDPWMASWKREDFTTYTVGDWAVTETGAAGTIAQTDVLGGGILLTTANTENDSEEMQKAGEAYQLTSGKPLWFETIFQVSEATEIDFIAGLCITDTAAIDGVTDGIYFLKSDAATDIYYHCEMDSEDTTADTGVDVVAATDLRLGLKFNRANAVEYWVNRSRIAHIDTNIPTDELLRITLGVQTGSAHARTLTWKGYEIFQIL